MDGYQRNFLHNDDFDAAGYSSEPIRKPRRPGAEALCEPLVFAGCFGWYHPGHAQLGVVLCGPHGYEELCVHRHWRALANALAQQDMPTLRFDYAGTGNSQDDDDAPDRVQAWIGSIVEAVRTLRRIAGVERVALVGLRMGAVLAAAAAEQIDDLAALVLLAPTGSGDACVRELQALAMLPAPRDQDHGQHHAGAIASGGLEAAGFVYTSQTIADLRALPLPARRLAEDVLVLHRPDAVPDPAYHAPAHHAQAYHARVTRCGAAVEEDVFDDCPALLRDPDVSVYPHQGFDRVVGWLAARRGGTRRGPSAMTRLTLLRMPEAEEKPVFVSRSPDLFGVLCRPYGSPRPTAVVLLNTGANHSIGTSRMTVMTARRLAGAGFASLRLDIRGIGESDAPLSGAADPTVDVSSALDTLRDRGFDDFILIGFGSGARLALETTLRDHRVRGQILLNLRGLWTPSEAAAHGGPPRAWFRATGPLSPWQRMVRGTVDGYHATKTIMRRGARAVARNAGETWGRIWQTDSVRGIGMSQFRGLAARNVQTQLVFADKDPGLDELAMVCGRRDPMLQAIPNVAITVLNEADDIFAWNHSRQQLLSVVERTLTAMTAPTANPPMTDSSTA